MKNYKCAHCAHCNEIKYGGFFCDKTGCLECKRVEDKCRYFKPDRMSIINAVQKVKGCKYCEDRAYTKKPFMVITPKGHRVDICFNFCPNCGADMRKGCKNEK